jgi:hypothetical protein
VGIGLVDYESCNKLYDGNIVDSAMLCVGVPDWSEHSCQDYSKIPFLVRKARGRKDWIDATIFELSSSTPVPCGGRLSQQQGWRCPRDYVEIEVKYDDFPAETGWTLRDSAGTLFAGQSTGTFSTEGGTVSKTTYITEECTPLT